MNYYLDADEPIHFSTLPLTSPPRAFHGTRAIFQLLVIDALLIRSRSAWEIEKVSGYANALGVIARLRRKGLNIPCERVPLDGRGRWVYLYSLSDADRAALAAWLEGVRS
jgi:hypothetical protein